MITPKIKQGLPELPPSIEIQMTPFAFRVNDATKIIGLSRGSLYDLEKSGKLRFVRIAGRTLVPADELRRLIAEAA